MLQTLHLVLSASWKAEGIMRKRGLREAKWQTEQLQSQSAETSRWDLEFPGIWASVSWGPHWTSGENSECLPKGTKKMPLNARGITNGNKLGVYRWNKREVLLTGDYKQLKLSFEWWFQLHSVEARHWLIGTLGAEQAQGSWVEKRGSQPYEYSRKKDSSWQEAPKA